MSTADQLIDEIQHRIPETGWDNIFPVINRAIRVMATRLFTLKSDLIIGEMSISAFGQVTYTASVAFNAGTSAASPTITDAANLFVSTGFTAGMHITTDSTTNPGPFKIVTAAAGTLTLLSTDTVVTATAASRIITSDPNYADLPSDFWGLVDRGVLPYISTKSYSLQPLPDEQLPIQFKSGGDPYWFKIKGMKLYLTPPAGSNITIKGDYFQKPASITRMTDTIPFNELLDAPIQEFIVETVAGGTAMSDAKLNQFLERQVDVVVNNRSLSAPYLMTGLNWDNL